jgi:putative membrane protein
MMRTLKHLLATGTLLMATGFCAHALADISADNFVEEASAKGIAEIETARIALEKSTSAPVREFAQQMITDHTAANNELRQLAQRKNLDVADDAELMNKAKAFILKQRDGESFDQAYANNQVVAHEKTIELFRDATRSQDAEIKVFATKTLPKLEQHLQKAKALQRTTGAKTDADTDRDGRLNRGTMDHSDTTTDDRTTTRPGAGSVPQTQYSE